MKHHYNYVVVISSLVLGGLFLLTWYQFSKETRVIINETIMTDMSQLKDIFAEIHKECVIMGFDHDKNYVDFLTVKSFVSSEVGAMNLMFPEKWQGPYVQDNPAIQGKKYEIVRVKEGYYLMPGTGVRLSNDKVMGTDIIVTPTIAIDSLLTEESGLLHEGTALCVQIATQKSPLVADMLEEEDN